MNQLSVVFSSPHPIEQLTKSHVEPCFSGTMRYEFDFETREKGLLLHPPLVCEHLA